MLHNRFPTELRNHVSTVGPSPQTSSPADSAATSNPTFGPRLVAFAPIEAVTTPSARILPQLLHITARRCASFFAEAAVLVLIFGILDRLLSCGHVGLPWLAGTLAVSLALLAASILTDFSHARQTAHGR